MKYRVDLPLNGFYCDLQVLARKLASPFSHPTLLSTQAQLVTACDYLWVCLARALGYWTKKTMPGDNELFCGIGTLSLKKFQAMPFR